MKAGANTRIRARVDRTFDPEHQQPALIHTLRLLGTSPPCTQECLSIAGEENRNTRVVWLRGLKRSIESPIGIHLCRFARIHMHLGSDSHITCACGGRSHAQGGAILQSPKACLADV